MHLHCLKILLTIPLCNMMPCLLYRHILFFSLIPSFLFFTPSKRSQNSLTTITHILDVLFILNIYIYSYLHRNSRSQIFFKVGVLKNFSNFTGKHQCQSFSLIRLQTWGLQLYQETPTQVFSCKICKIFKNAFFYRTPPVAASVYTSLFTLFIYPYVLFILLYQLDKIDKIWGM